MYRRYKYLDTVFEYDQSCQVLTVCSFTASEECEMKLNSLINSKRRTVRKFLLSPAYLQSWALKKSSKRKRKLRNRFFQAQNATAKCATEFLEA